MLVVAVLALVGAVLALRLPIGAAIAVGEVESQVAAIPGVESVSTEVDHTPASGRQARWELLGQPQRSRGDLTVTVSVAAAIEPRALADLLGDVRTTLADGGPDRYDVSIVTVQQGTGRQVFDGWWHHRDPRAFAAEDLLAISTFALSLPDGAWLDLDASTFELGAFDEVGPPRFRGLLDDDVDRGYTLTVPVETMGAAELLAEASRLLDAAAAGLDGPTAIELRDAEGATVRVATEPEAFPDAVGELSALVSDLSDPSLVRMDVEAGFAYGFVDAQAVTTATLDVAIDLGAPGCESATDEHDRLLTGVERALDELEVEPSVTVVPCATP